MARTDANTMKGAIRIKRQYDIRKDPKTGQKTDVPPVVCMCCHKEIFNVTELVNGDVIGPGCDGLICYDFPAARKGYTLNAKQAAYAKSRGLL